ncbi:MAG: hypothetical protein BACD_04226 [Bacteroides rodentium]
MVQKMVEKTGAPARQISVEQKVDPLVGSLPGFLIRHVSQ